MRNLYLLLCLSAAMTFSACSPDPVPRQKALTLVDTVPLDPEMLQEIRSFVCKQLHIPVRVINESGLAGANSFQTLEKSAAKKRHEMDVLYIVLATIDDDQHLAVFEKSRIAIVNARALHTENAMKFHRRIERQIMRAAAFCVGLPPTPDPFCVTRNYKSLEDLDQMGRNYSPPWQGRFAEKAKELGLLIEREGDHLKGKAVPAE
jgi:predicted Zn-dependent protease